jgi:hypothetical protein
LACLLSIAPAAIASADESSGGAMPISPAVMAPSGGAWAGKASTIAGHIDDYSGDVTVLARLGSKGVYSAVASATTDALGDFNFRWKPAKAGRWTIRIEPRVNVVSAASVQASSGALSVYRRQKATWYGPGWYGSRTACGKKLTKRTLGVAHRTLPCGTRVEFYLRGRRITVPVIDRGPFVRGVTWDLTLAAMKKLGSSSTEIVGAVSLGK